MTRKRFSDDMLEQDRPGLRSVTRRFDEAENPIRDDGPTILRTPQTQPGCTCRTPSVLIGEQRDQCRSIAVDVPDRKRLASSLAVDQLDGPALGGRNDRQAGAHCLDEHVW